MRGAELTYTLGSERERGIYHAAMPCRCSLTVRLHPCRHQSCNVLDLCAASACLGEPTAPPLPHTHTRVRARTRKLQLSRRRGQLQEVGGHVLALGAGEAKEAAAEVGHGLAHWAVVEDLPVGGGEGGVCVLV